MLIVFSFILFSVSLSVSLSVCLQALEKYYCSRQLGYTRDGLPISYERLGRVDLRGECIISCER